MYFPRSDVRGSNQGLKLVGGTSSMFEAQKEINRVLYVWRGEYDAFKERQSRRRRMAANVKKMETPDVGSWPSLSEKATSKAVVGKNPFSALDGVVEETSLVPIVVPKKVTLKGWSRVASKPAAVSSMKTVVVSATDVLPEMTMDEPTKSALRAGTIDWGDFADKDGEW
jgi:hypothetical protein